MLFVCEQIGSTRRGKPLTGGQKLKLHESQGGICPLCGLPMLSGEKLRDEHLTALGLGGSNDLDNRGLVHATCAYAKTFGSEGDIAKIAEAKRRKILALGLKTPKRGLRGKGFPSVEPQCRATRPLSKICNPPIGR